MDSLKKPAVRRSQLFASKDLDDQWYSKWTDYIIIYDEKDVFGTGRTFFFSTQTSMVYEGPFDPSVARQSKQRHQLLSLRLYRTGKVREACVFSRADHGGFLLISYHVWQVYNFGRIFLIDISEEALHCVCRALEADLLKLMHDGVDPSIAYMRLCNSSSDTPKNIHRLCPSCQLVYNVLFNLFKTRSEILTSRKMAAWTHPLAPMLVVRLDAQLDLEGLPEQSRALLRPSDGDHTSNSGQDVAVARSQQAPGMQARAASAGGTKPLASQRTAEHVEMVDLDSDKVEGDTATDDQDTPSEVWLIFPYI